MTSPIASLSLDLDNQWSYMKTHGDAHWESFPSYLALAVPRILEFLAERGLTITFFVVGQDAALEKNRDAIASIAEAGHEIGNHSFRHEPWLHLYSDEEIEADIGAAEEHLHRVTGQRPVGFRGPGYSMSPSLLRVLAQRGYEYDASSLPTFLGPAARAYYFLTARLTDEQKRKRKALFGKFSDGFQPLRPHWRGEGSQRILEIPVTTAPLVKTPMHASYLLYLARFSKAAARAYFRTALRLCRLTRIGPSLLLHPLDFLGGDDVSELAFFPGMDLSSDQKMALLDEVIELFTGRFRVTTIREHARAAAESLGPPRSAQDLLGCGPSPR